jgi:hypothetical protein
MNQNPMRLALLGIDLCARRLPVCRHDYRADMEIRWDWLEPLLTVPYLPALDPAHPAAVTPGLFMEVIGIAGTGRFLPLDKDHRWGDRKVEYVLAGSDPSPRNPAWSCSPR